MPTPPLESSANLPDGGAWAAILAAGIGCLALGLCIDLAEASKAISNAMNFYNPTGDLAGKSTIAVLVWLVSWMILHARWKNRNLRSPGKISAVMLILVALAMVAAFPPFFELFAAA